MENNTSSTRTGPGATPRPTPPRDPRRVQIPPPRCSTGQHFAQQNFPNLLTCYELRM